MQLHESSHTVQICLGARFWYFLDLSILSFQKTQTCILNHAALCMSISASCSYPMFSQFTRSIGYFMRALISSVISCGEWRHCDGRRMDARCPGPGLWWNVPCAYLLLGSHWWQHVVFAEVLDLQPMAIISQVRRAARNWSSKDRLLYAWLWHGIGKIVIIFTLRHFNNKYLCMVWSLTFWLQNLVQHVL